MILLATLRLKPLLMLIAHHNPLQVEEVCPELRHRMFQDAVGISVYRTGIEQRHDPVVAEDFFFNLRQDL